MSKARTGGLMSKSVRWGALWVCVAALLWVAAAATGAQIGIVKPEVCVYVDAPHPPLYTGHAFLQLIPENFGKPPDRTRVYGFTAEYPVLAITGGPGLVVSNATHTWTYRICYKVFHSVWVKMKDAILKDEQHPPNYSLFKFNCTDWVLKIAAVGGLKAKIPAASPPRKGSYLLAALVPGGLVAKGVFAGALAAGLLNNVNDPETLAEALKAIGVGKKYNGGLVEGNPNNLAPSMGPIVRDTRGNVLRDRRSDPVSSELDVDSYAGLADFALLDPSRLAAGMGLHNDERPLAPETVGTNGLLTLGFAHVRAAKAIIAVNWGDRTITVQHTKVTHHYSQPGTYLIRAAVVRDATLFRVTFEEHVVAGDASQSMRFIVPLQRRPTVVFPLPAPPPIP